MVVTASHGTLLSFVTVLRQPENIREKPVGSLSPRHFVLPMIKMAVTTGGSKIKAQIGLPDTETTKRSVRSPSLSRF